jgi:2-C-methyl-D-erythritol 4-phosphate cytidylyltransferase
MGGERPKQFLSLAGRPLLVHALDTLNASPLVDELVLVAPVADLAEARELAAPFAKLRAVVEGGKSRRASVAAGLAAAGPESGILVVHDAARPLLRPELVARVVEAARLSGAAVPALPVRDTVKRVEGGKVLGTVPREPLVTVQTPQAFRADWLRRAHAEVGEEVSAPDDAALLEALGLPVVVVPGQGDNLKVTESRDLELAGILLDRRRGGGP